MILTSAQQPALSPRREAGLLLVAVLLLHLAGTGALPLCDRDEPRFAEASREMRQRHDYVVPWLNNQPRYDKPPLIYWLQVAGYRLGGENEVTARLPSVIASALTSLALYGFGRRLGGRAVGLWAAILFATCLQTLAHSKLAVADMQMILYFTLACWSGWEISRPSDKRAHFGWWWALAGSLALAFLAKGPVGWLPILLPFTAAAAARLPKPTRRLHPGFLALVVLGLVALWGVPALSRTHGDFWRVGMGRHVFQRSVGVLDGHGAAQLLTYIATLPFYFVTVWVSFFPWSIWLVWLVRRLWQRRRVLDFDEGFLVTGCLIVFGVFTLVRTKLPHYTLPAFPLLCLLLAREWQRTESPWRWPVRLAIGSAALALALSLIAFPRLAPLFPARALAVRCAPWLRPDTEIATAEFNEPSLCWQFRREVRGYVQLLSPAELPAFMGKAGPRVCVAPTREANTVFPHPPSEWHRVQVHGFNLADGKPVDLTAFVKPGGP